MRVGIKGCFSSLGRIFGDEVIYENPRRAEHGICLKVADYGIIDMAESNDHTGKKILLSRGGGGARGGYLAGRGRAGSARHRTAS